MTASTPDITCLPDEDLMLLIANGVIQLPASELFRRHNRGLFNYMAWMCQGNVHEAEDVAQKTWLKVMTRCADYRPRAAFRTFLYQIAHHAWLDGRGAAFEASRALIDDACAIPSDDLSPEAEWHLKQNLQRVRQALLHLPIAQREVIVLRFFNELSLEEIAVSVGEDFETVKSRLRYAYARLRRELELHP